MKNIEFAVFAHVMAMLLQDIRFDMTVTLGNVLTILAFGTAAMAFGLRLEARMKSNEEASERHEKWIDTHMACTKTQTVVLSELREAIAYMRGRNRFQEREHGED